MNNPTLKEDFNLEDWAETHFEIVSRILDNEDNLLKVLESLDDLELGSGTGGLWTLAKKWTDEFEELTKDITWGEENPSTDEYYDYYTYLDDFVDKEYIKLVERSSR